MLTRLAGAPAFRPSRQSPAPPSSPHGDRYRRAALAPFPECEERCLDLNGPRYERDSSYRQKPVSLTSAAIRSTRARLVFAVLAQALAGQAIPEAKVQSDEAGTVQACRNAWNSASARPTCSSTPNDIRLSSDQCRIKKSCQFYGITDFGVVLLQHKPNDLTLPLAEVDGLHNCDETLTVGSC